MAFVAPDVASVVNPPNSPRFGPPVKTVVHEGKVRLVFINYRYNSFVYP